MATFIVPRNPETRFADPSIMSYARIYKDGALVEPLVHYNYDGRILTDERHLAGAGGVLTATGMFTSRNIFGTAATGNWQLPTAVQILAEIESEIYGPLFPKQPFVTFLGQSAEFTTTFRNDTALFINLTTNTGLTLVPSPIPIPPGSNVRLIFEVVDGRFATAAINVYVENSGGGSATPLNLTYNTNTSFENVSWDPVTMQLYERGPISDSWEAVLFTTPQLITGLYVPVTGWSVFFMPALTATFAPGSGTLTIVKPGPWTISARFTLITLVVQDYTGLAPSVPSTLPAGQNVSLILQRNGTSFTEMRIGDEGIASSTFTINLNTGDTLQWLVAQTGGAPFQTLRVGSAWYGLAPL